MNQPTPNINTEFCFKSRSMQVHDSHLRVVRVELSRQRVRGGGEGRRAAVADANARAGAVALVQYVCRKHIFIIADTIIN